MSGNGLFTKLFCLIACFCIQGTQAIWDGEKLWYVEHQFKYEDAVMEVNKGYLGGNYTQYDWKLAKLDDGLRGLRVAFQWAFANGTNSGLIFQF